MLRAGVPAVMVESRVSVDEELAGAFAVVLAATIIGTLGLFRIVVEGTFDAVHETGAKVEALIDQCTFNLFQGDLEDVVAQLQ